jgi:uncharacterized protein (DUF58 family)
MEHYLEHADPLDSRQFLIAVKRIADSLSYGTDSSRFLGQGLEYVQSRPYQPGDPVKSIDWRVTARMSKVYVKEYEVPKCIPVWLVVDTSSSMAISSLPLSKYSLAVQTAGGIALACLDRVSPVGVLGAGEKNILVKPSLSRDTVLQWMHDLRHHRMDEQTRLGTKLKALEASLKSKSLIIILSDFHDPTAIATLKLLGANHDCIALQYIDPSENSTTGAGFFHGSEAETGASFLAHSGRQHSDPNALAAALKKASIDHLMIQTDQPVIQRLRYFLQSRGVLTGKG